jgi:hypothetical protein
LFRKYILLTTLLLVAAFAGRFAYERFQIVDLPDRSGRATTPGIGGFVDAARIKDGRLAVEGWAGDLKANVPAVAVLIFVGAREVMAIDVRVERQDVAAARRAPAMRASGFEGAAPFVSVPGELRAFARTADGRYGELKVAGRARDELARTR